MNNKKNKQLTLPGLNTNAENSTSIKPDGFSDVATKSCASIINLQKHRLKVDREEEKRELDSFLDYYKIF